MSKPYPKYKDSGVEGLGVVPEHWEVKPLKALASVNDETLAENTDAEYKIEYVDIGSVTLADGIQKTETFLFREAPSRARRLVKDGDVLVSTVRTYLKAIAPVESPPSNLIASTGFAVVRPGTSFSSRFARYVLQAPSFVEDVIARSTGVSYPAINASDMARILLPAPPITEQSAIAAFLDHETAKIDALVEEQRRLIALLKEKRQAVISHAVTKGLNPNAPMKDSGIEWLGEVPEHWRVSPLRYLTHQIVDGTHFTPTYVEKGVPFLRVTDITTPEMNVDELKNIPEEEHRELIRRCKPVKGDLLLSKNGTIGVPKVVTWDWEFSIFVSLCLIKLSHLLNANYASYVFQSDPIKLQTSEGTKQSTVSNLHLEKIAKFIFPVPPLDEQLAIVANLDTRASELQKLIEQAEAAEKLLLERRTALISAAVTGKIDVRGFAAKEAEAA